MEGPFPHVVSVNPSGEGLVVCFSDGKRGVYSDALLYSILELTDPVDTHDHRISDHVFEPKHTTH